MYDPNAPIFNDKNKLTNYKIKYLLYPKPNTNFKYGFISYFKKN